MTDQIVREGEQVMKAYYTEYAKLAHNRRKFIYISLDLADAKRLFATLKNYTGDKEIHITTDRNFDQYIELRKTVPVMVQVCSTLIELDKRLELIGVYL